MPEDRQIRKNLRESPMKNGHVHMGGGDYLPSDPEPPYVNENTVTVHKYTMLLFFYRLCEADGTYEVNFVYFKSDALIQHTNTVKLCYICYILMDSCYLWV